MRLRPLVLTLTVLGGIGVGGAALLREARDRYVAPGPLQQAKTIIVPHGTHTEVGEALLKAGLIFDPRSFGLAAMLTAAGGPLRASEFVFPANASLRDVLVILRTAKPVQHRITIPEGLTAAQIATLLDHASALSGDVLVPAEGALLPESYAYEHGMSRAQMVERAAVAMQRTLARLWGERDQSIPFQLPQQLVTLASIIERETARPEERARIAGVFINRLKRNMPLQSDPTVIYAVSGGAMCGGRTLTRADLDSDNPYNTYRNPGLPPGPIGSPGLAAMQAAARPLATDELFFVADGTGGHVFARTLDEHNRNVTRWRAMQPR
ncbi:MAG: endolytic transglycosylase MltG [Alphaproteobacteria bacterium]|nr:endolytic transglycosylase MltG [Alphaproteobacteria bacterium]